MPEIGEIRRACEINRSGGKWIWHACEGCGKERWVILSKGQPESRFCLKCACHLKGQNGSKHPCWNGGKSPSNGYIMIRLQPDDFFFPMASKSGVVSEHRLVMAKHLNRCLLPWEVIHHKNGTRNDNRIENLELLSSSKYHLVDTVTKSRIKRLEQIVENQAKQIRLLQWHILEKDKINKEVNEIVY